MAKQAKPEFKVYVGVLSNQATVPAPFAESLAQMARPRGTIVEFVTGKTPDVMRTKIAQKTVDEGFTHALMLDTDMVYPHSTIWDLLLADKDIVSGFCVGRTEDDLPIFLVQNDTDKWLFNRRWPPSTEGVHEVGATGGCALMVKHQVFRQVPRPWFVRTQKNANGGRVSPDVYFSVVAREHGFRVHCHVKVRAHHLVEYGFVPTVKDGNWKVVAEMMKR
jgi:hypothetical protein